MYALICGLLIGACDMVPGISGGTMALILGIYEPLVSFKNKKFIGLVLLGILTSILTLSSFFHLLLQSEEKIYLYSLFFGLVMGSAWFVGKGISVWNRKTFTLLALGALSAWGVTHAPVLIVEPSGVLFYFWLGLSGAIAVCAMLLPGISGSYIMMIMGPYPLVIESLSKLSRGEWLALKVLLPVGLGIAIGAPLFSKWITFALKYHKEVTLSILLGFMLGATSTIFPFQNRPEWDFSTLGSVLVMGLGLMAVLILESKLSKRYTI